MSFKRLIDIKSPATLTNSQTLASIVYRYRQCNINSAGSGLINVNQRLQSCKIWVNGIWVIYFHVSQCQIRWKIAICSNLCTNFSAEGPNSFSYIFSTIPFTLLLLHNNPHPWQLMSNCQNFFKFCIIVHIYYYYYRGKLSMNSWCQKIEGLHFTETLCESGFFDLDK